MEGLLEDRVDDGGNEEVALEPMHDKLVFEKKVTISEFSVLCVLRPDAARPVGCRIQRIYSQY